MNPKILKNQILESKLLAAIHKEPGRCKSQYCRTVNGQKDNEQFCKNMECYANAWKRKAGRTHKAPCKYRKPSVWRKIKLLLEAGFITVKKEKVKDQWMSRGWDWMKVCRPSTPGGI